LSNRAPQRGVSALPVRIGRIRIPVRAAVAIALLLLPALVSAHGDLHDQILAATNRIAESPNDARLYLKRGELYRLHGEVVPALADYDRAAQLDPSLAETDLGRGRTLADANRHEEARRALRRFLAKKPDHAEGRIALARVLVKLGRGAQASVEFTRALWLSSAPKPDVYVERAAALAAAHRIDEAIRGLDEGIAKLGPLVSLEEPAIHLEVRRKTFDSALARLDRAASLSTRRETWLARRGEILIAAGRRREALRSLRQARAAIESLPPRLKQTRAIERLQSQVRSCLEELETGPPREEKSDAKS
jgi:predicted Zn-dependent protease